MRTQSLNCLSLCTVFHITTAVHSLALPHCTTNVGLWRTLEMYSITSTFMLVEQTCNYTCECSDIEATPCVVTSWLEFAQLPFLDEGHECTYVHMLVSTGVLVLCMCACMPTGPPVLLVWPGRLALFSMLGGTVWLARLFPFVHNSASSECKTKSAFIL